MEASVQGTFPDVEVVIEFTDRSGTRRYGWKYRLWTDEVVSAVTAGHLTPEIQADFIMDEVVEGIEGSVWVPSHESDGVLWVATHKRRSFWSGR